MQFNDKRIRFFSMPILALLILLATHWQDVILKGTPPSWLQWYLMCLVNTIVIWEGCRKIMLYFIHKYSHYSQTQYRLILQSLTVLVYLLIVTYMLDELICKILLNQAKEEELLEGFQHSLVPTFIVMLIYETAFFFYRWKEYMIKTEALARANVQSQLDALKSQIDPHFLFNSLNTLAALIDDENIDAQEYLSKLADVYRYVLINKEKNTVSIAEEIDFINAYIYLNKTRFRENLQVELAVPPTNYSQRIAPLSLQILVENAIKHNVISPEKPLNIKILCNEDYLVVENNLQEKRTFEQSTKVGLQNIKNRYALLCQTPIEIIKTTQFFTVRLPILSAV
jgi:two-component system LytT family sensor kinase